MPEEHFKGRVDVDDPPLQIDDKKGVSRVLQRRFEDPQLVVGTLEARQCGGPLIAVALERGQFGEGAVIDPGWGFRLMCMVTLTSGTAFIMWLGEQITERGNGNGISMVIFASRPTACATSWARA